MRKVWIRLPSVQQVQKFVATLTPLEGDFELIRDGFILDARSLMGIMGFNLAQPLCLKVYRDTPENMKALAPYMIDTEDTSDEQ